MYESPINIMVQDMQAQMDGEILRAIQKVNIVVDKDELTKALVYDRQQYERGFKDGTKVLNGVKARIENIINETSTSYRAFSAGLSYAISIIDEYMGENI